MNKNFIILLIAVFGIITKLLAQYSFYEIEPNDSPNFENKIIGEVSIIAEMNSTDQDGFMWSVSDEDANYPWSFELEGITGALTLVDVMRITFSDDGKNVTDSKSFFKFGSKYGSKPVRQEKLLFDPGEYFIGIARAGGGEQSSLLAIPELSMNGEKKSDEENLSALPSQDQYRLKITKGKNLYAKTPKKNSVKKPFKLNLNREMNFYTEEQDNYFKFKISDKEVQKRWKLAGNLPIGRSMKITLSNGQGKKLLETATDQFGRFSVEDIGLEKGDYLLHTSSKKNGFIYSVGMFETGTRVEGEESEPNDRWEQANIIDFSLPIHGRSMIEDDNDYFRFHMDEEMSSNTWNITLKSAENNNFSFCLKDKNGLDIQCRDAKGEVILNNLSLPVGDYGLLVSRAPKDANYTIEMKNGSIPKPFLEAEPNDKFIYASAMHPKRIIKGKFQGEDVDHFHFTVSGKPQLWRIQAVGNGIQSLALMNNNQKTSQELRGHNSERLRLSNLFLLPGKHTVRIRGKDGKYTLRVLPSGEPSPRLEREPNNDESRSHPIVIGKEKIGLLDTKEDIDYYRFSLQNNDHIQLTITSPLDGEIFAEIQGVGSEIKTHLVKNGNIRTYRGLLPAGNYTISLHTKKPSNAEYKIKLERLARFECIKDCEPNDHRGLASLIPSDGLIEGKHDFFRDNDYYKLPVYPVDTNVTFKQLTERKANFYLYKEYDNSGDWDGLKWDDASNVHYAKIPANTQIYLMIDGFIAGEEAYKIQYQATNTIAVEMNNSELPVNFQVDTEVKTVAAYRSYGQSLTAMATLSNESNKPLTLKLESATSDLRWRVEPQQTDISLEPNEQKKIPISVIIPNDAWANNPVRISLNILGENGNHKETWFEVDVENNATPVNSIQYWSIPKKLLGGLNVGWKGLQAIRTPEDIKTNTTDIGDRFDEVLDNLSVQNNGLWLRGGRKEEATLTVKLAGELPVEIIGTMFNQVKGELDKKIFLLDFEIALSSDGQTFATVYKGKLQPVLSDQFILFDSPKKAKYARLTLISNQNGTKNGRLNLGEWKIITSGDTDITDKKGFNIADPKKGGHVVYSSVQSDRKWDRSLLTEEEDIDAVRMNPGERPLSVIGFFNQRAATITRIEWINSKKVKPTELMKNVDIYVSVDTPAGPWKKVGEMNPLKNHIYHFDTPQWARYVKFSAEPVNERKEVMFPEIIRIFEQPVNPSYQSILGEWGNQSKAAIYEKTFKNKITAINDPVDNNSKEKALPIHLGENVSGTVEVNKEEDWYSIDIPDGKNTLKIKVQGNPTVKTIIQMTDDQGEPVLLNKIDRQPSQELFEALVEPKKRYFIHIAEPPRNIIFVWDTSGSVNPYRNLIYNALSTYAEDVTPGIHQINFLPFGGELLAPQWYDQSYILQTILQEYKRNYDSSEAETTLIEASKALENREGNKAIILITDALTNRNIKLWDKLLKLQPSIFTLGLVDSNAFGANSTQQLQLMQSWSTLGEGYYKTVVSLADMERGMDRAAMILSQPAEYVLELNATHKIPPKPGKLTILSPKQKMLNPNGAVELILDASGSMLKRLNGKRRITIAKEVLIDAINNTIPKGTLTALRVFGHKKPNSCQTDLELKLAPLDTHKVVKQIKKINAKNLAKTPIADSLKMVGKDLRKAKGKKIVILLTDGKETCDGDPYAVIKELNEKGIDIRLNIVGFAIDDPQIAEEFESWANEGGGQYFNTDSASSLSDALKKALQVPYIVYNQVGEKVGEGTVGGRPLTLNAGLYTVKVFTSTVQTYEKVKVISEKESRLELR